MGKEYIRIPDEVIDDIKKNVVPICFHCGEPYIKDSKYCGPDHNTWMPYCKCINKTTIRIITGPAS